ncbi:MAG: peptide chain release factor N(5)-glutamine methyltransferase [Nitrospiraceae bacterium]|nr:peptide chain release factor N(5)-glutamine methyltransferase [Nitrospiraceae bacterium]
MTIIETINRSASQLSSVGITTGRLDAELLLCHTLGKDRAWLLAHIREAVDEQHRELFEQAVDRRALREPLQYILGKQEFWGLDFMVTQDVLIPRPETELIIETALTLVPNKDVRLTILDLCTGSGCIAVSLAKELASARIFASDKSEKALDVARENARRHGVADHVRFLEGDLFGSLEELDLRGRVDIMVSNPPYVPSEEFSTLQPEVRDHEPGMALLAGQNGTEVHRRIIDEAPVFLRSKGALIMEMGIGQAGALVQMIQESGSLEGSEVLKDLAGIERVIIARKK